jgi:DNA topoisomerase-1
MENIIIVESPSKSHTISSYLGSDYKVVASVGHIRDLATSGKEGLGIDIENNFKPTYVTIKGKEKLVAELKKLCKGKKVFLATDPDREGEAISYHLKEVLKLKDEDYSRIEFHEITKESVLDSFNHQRKVDMNLVDSQETRRMIDRIIGFRLSKLLQSRIKSKSAGRVQSVALKLIVDLEKEILAFVSTPYYELLAKKDDLELDFVSYKDNKETIVDKKLAEEILNSLSNDFVVTDVTNKEVERLSRPAYTTSTMQQDASNKLDFSSQKTMSVAQSLYEGKNIGTTTTGLITYMRTDSTRLADEFVKDAKAYIVSKYGKEYVGFMHTKSQKLAQDAHEAIRVTDINRTPESIKKYLTPDEFKLYQLIYTRTICSLMAKAIDNRLTVLFKNNDTLWRVTYTTNVFDGFTKADVFYKKEEKAPLPNLAVGDILNGFDVSIKELFTKPKSRYTEATLIKDMEDLGIGRPSTYAQTLTTLKERDYIRVEQKKLIPTEQGILTTEALDKYFSSIINVKYTANMENNLDLIAKGEVEELTELNEFYNSFNPVFLNAKETMEKVQPKLLDELCPVCGSPLCERISRYKKVFIGCSNYPTCTYIKPDENKTPSEDTGIVCPKCNKGTFIKRIATRGKSKGEAFYACSCYPKCKNIVNDEPTNEKCPKCGAMMLKGKDGNLYCSQDCDSPKTYDLSDMLKEFRTQEYKKNHCKPYMVFTNEELEKIASLRPISKEDFIKDNIFKYNAEDKIEKYGEGIIAVVNEYLSK